MTIPSTPRRAGPFTGNGATTSFPFAFKVFAPTDVKVVVANSAGVWTTLALNSDYSVTLNPNQDTSPGGVVTYPLRGSPLPPGSVLSIIGNIDYSQPLDLPSGGNFSPLALENQLDRTTMQIQQLREEMDRAARLPPTSSESAEELVDDLQRIADSADNLDTVAGSIGKVNTVASNIANVNTVGTNIANVNAVGTNIAAVVTVANDLNEPVSEIDTVASNIANVNTVGTNIANVNAVGTNIANVNTVASNIANVNTVGTNIANVNAVGTNIAAVVTVANDLNEPVSEIDTVASSIANVDAVGGSIANVNTVAGAIGNVNTVATNIANVNAVGTNIAKVNTVAANLADVTNYADTYLGPKASHPTTRNDGSALRAGDLYFNTTTDTLYVYYGTAWSGVGSSNIGPASETVAGIVKLATTADVQAGTDTTRVVTPAGLAAAGAPKLRTPRTITIGKTGKSFDGSTNVSWSLDEIGAIGYGILPGGFDLNTAVAPGCYRLEPALVNAPGGVEHGQLLVVRGGADTIFQIATGYSNGEIYWRQGNPPNIGGPGTWSRWRRFWHEDNTPSSAGPNGWAMLPGGVIIQWGRLHVGDPGIDYFGTAYFPITFPNNIFQVSTTLYSYNWNLFDATVGVTAHRLSSFDFTVQEWNDIKQNIDVTYIAIGS